MSTILHTSFASPTSRPLAARKRNPIDAIGQFGQTICFNAECSLDGSTAAVEMSIDQAEELVLELRAAIYAASGRKV